MDDISQIADVDKSNMRDILARFAEQLDDAWNRGGATEVPGEFSRVRTILCLGMGGSAIGGDLLRCYLRETLGIPIVVNRDYNVPHFVDDDCLVIVSSYSGNTEETLSAYEDAKTRGGKILCISSDGELAKQAKEDGWPLITIPAGYPPRTALGYLAIPSLIILAKLGLIPDQDGALDEAIDLMKQLAKRYGVDVKRGDNLAKQTAEKLSDRLPVIYSAGSGFEVVSVRWRGQLSENAEVLAYSNSLPEMNHNEIVGWNSLGSFQKEVQVIILRDSQDHDRVKLRMDITEEIISRHAPTPIELYSEGKTLLSRIFSLIYLGDWVSFYLAVLRGVDPTPVKNIDLLKKRMQEA